MSPEPNPSPRSTAQVAADEERLATIAAALADAVETVVPRWIESLVIGRMTAYRGEASPAVVADAGAAGRAACDELMPVLRELLGTDIDEQAANPLELLRAVTRHAGVVLQRHGVPPVRRDEFATRSFPDDVYDLMPATWSDIDDELHELGITWGAAKAHVHKARRRDQGMA